MPGKPGSETMPTDSEDERLLEALEQSTQRGARV